MHDISVEGFIESFDRRYPTFILKTLLCDRTTGRNIIWADNEYEALGDGYMGDDEMTVEKITGMNSGVIKPRIAKEQEKQSQRTKSRAEVFTPSWLCNQMNNDLDEAWFGRRDVFNTEIVADDGANTWTPTSDPIEFPKSKGHGWRAYVEATRLEITCGEAPFVCSRYDTVTGDEIPVGERVGFLDRKLRVVTEKTKTRKEWVRRALDAARDIRLRVPGRQPAYRSNQRARDVRRTSTQSLGFGPPTGRARAGSMDCILELLADERLHRRRAHQQNGR